MEDNDKGSRTPHREEEEPAERMPEEDELDDESYQHDDEYMKGDTCSESNSSLGLFGHNEVKEADDNVFDEKEFKGA